MENNTNLEASTGFSKNNIEYQLKNTTSEEDDGSLVPENWREIADMRLKMLDKEYEKVTQANICTTQPKIDSKSYSIINF